jgi:hypothetical protein
MTTAPSRGGDAHPAAAVIPLLVDVGGAVGVVADRAAAVTDRGRQVLHTAVHGMPHPRLPAEVDLRVDAHVTGRPVNTRLSGHCAAGSGGGNGHQRGECQCGDGRGTHHVVHHSIRHTGCRGPRGRYGLLVHPAGGAPQGACSARATSFGCAPARRQGEAAESDGPLRGPPRSWCPRMRSEGSAVRTLHQLCGQTRNLERVESGRGKDCTSHSLSDLPA